MQTSVLVIAECGLNMNGSEEEAYRLVDAAIAAKADVCKFQKYTPELLTDDPEKLAMLNRLLLPDEAYIRLWKYCESKGIGFACTAFDAKNLKWLLQNTSMEFIKISSGQGENEALIEVAENAGMRVIQSIKKPARNLRFCEGWRYLWVVPEYPCPIERLNLKIITKEWCSGLSIHCPDTVIPAVAVGMGAGIIEAHLTLDRNQTGPDHTSSFQSDEFTEMVCNIRKTELALNGMENA